MVLLAKTLLRGPLRLQDDRRADALVEQRSFCWPEKKKLLNETSSWPEKMLSSSLPTKKNVLTPKVQSLDSVGEIGRKRERDNRTAENPSQNKKQKSVLPIAIRNLKSHCAEVLGGYWDIENVANRSRVSKRTVMFSREVFETRKRSVSHHNVAVGKKKRYRNRFEKGNNSKARATVGNNQIEKTRWCWLLPPPPKDKKRKRRRCMRCVEHGAPNHQAMDCPGALPDTQRENKKEGHKTDNSTVLYKVSKKMEGNNEDPPKFVRNQSSTNDEEEFYQKAVEAARELLISKEGQKYRGLEDELLVLV